MRGWRWREASAKAISSHARATTEGRCRSRGRACRIAGLPFVVPMRGGQRDCPGQGAAAVSKVIAIMSMSLDGFVADANDGVAEVFDWYFASGDVEINTGGADAMTFTVS